MKWFIGILGTLLVLIVVVITALSFYLTDARLKSYVMPPLQEALGDGATIDNLSYSLIRSFPNFGLVINKLDVPAADGSPLLSLEKLVLNMQLIPLLRDNISIVSLYIDDPSLTYVVYPDATTNIDFLLTDSTDTADSDDDMKIDLKKLVIRNGTVVYDDREGKIYTMVKELDLTTSIRMSDIIETDSDADLGGITFRMDGVTYLNDLKLHLTQTSEIDLENEKFTISKGTMNIRGLSLKTNGYFQNWSAVNPYISLNIESASDNFGTLLEMVPEEWKDEIKGIETRGSLTLRAEIKGEMGETLPPYKAEISITDGYLKHPKANRPIETVQAEIFANNDLVRIDRLALRADANTVSLQGNVNSLMSDEPVFDFDSDVNVDLGTLENFYPISDLGIQVRGLMQMKGTAKGVTSRPEEATFNTDISLQNGFLKYEDVEKPIEDINLEINATQALVTIKSFRARASVNEMSVTGTITQPLDTLRTRFDLRGEASLDMATIREFYPISEDTLQLRGLLTFNGRAQGRLMDAENANIDGRLTLANGYVNHRDFPKPIQNITLNTQISSNEISLQQFTMTSGENTFNGNGSIRNYLTDKPVVNITIRSNLILDEIDSYYSLEEFGIALTGTAAANLNVRGTIPLNTPAGQTAPMLPDDLQFRGSFTLQNATITGDSLPQPITGMNGELVFNDRDVELKQFRMQMASSDFSLNGKMVNYLNIMEDVGSKPPAVLTSSYVSRFFNVDEIYEYDPDAPSVEFPIELPNLNSSLTAKVDSMIFLGMTITNIQGTTRTTPKLIELVQSSANIFAGGVSGNFKWHVPQPNRTRIEFQGDITNVRAEEFFKEFKLGGKSKMHEYLSGGFNATATYSSEMDIMLDQDWNTTLADGTFGMDRARMKGHPIQNGIADLLSAPEFRDMSLDRWTATYGIKDGIFTVRDMNLTSTDIGLGVNGTQNLITDQLNFKMSLALPNRFNAQLERIITKDGVEALRKDENTIIIPLLLTGTSENPQVVIDRGTLQNMITDYLKKKAGENLEDAARRLLRGVGRN